MLSYGQQFDQLHALVKERDALKASYDKISADVKASKNKKPSAEQQAALDKLMLKDAEIIQEISRTENAVNFALSEAGKGKDTGKGKKETVRTIYKGDKSQELIIDSLSGVISLLEVQKDSVLISSRSTDTYVQSLQNELRSVATEKAQIQKDLDSAKTDKFILARRNWILLFFNLGVAILLTIALIYTIASLRRKKRASAQEQEQVFHKPRPITGFNQAVHKVAFDAFDSRLEKIEMLGRLKEKGLITEDEFLMQKQQLLNSKNKD